MDSGPVLAILMLTLVHFGAFAVLFWHLAGREVLGVFRLGSDDEGRGGPPKDAPPPPDPDGGRSGGLPLPAASPSPVRLREPARIGDAYERRPRRPEHVPAPEREPAAS